MVSLDDLVVTTALPAPTTRYGSSGVFGVTVLAALFAKVGGYESSEAFSDGMNTAVLVGAVAVAVGALAAFLIPGRGRSSEVLEARPEPLAEAA